MKKLIIIIILILGFVYGVKHLVAWSDNCDCKPHGNPYFTCPNLNYHGTTSQPYKACTSCTDCISNHCYHSLTVFL